MENPFNTIEQRLDDIQEQLNSLMDQSKNESDPDKLLTPEQVCKMLSISRVTLWNWDQKGILTAKRIGRLVRYSAADIKEFVNDKNKMI